jgi:hypothetical protein
MKPLRGSGTAIFAVRVFSKPLRTSRFAASPLPAERTHARRVTAPRASPFNRSKGAMNHGNDRYQCH